MEVAESGKIRVLKRDGTIEPFDLRKLAGTIWRAMRGTRGRFDDACQIALAIQIYIGRNKLKFVSSPAVFEMAAKVLRRVRLPAAANALQTHRAKRRVWRRVARVDHDGGRVTYWDKSWLAELACRSWHLTPRTGRIIASEVEERLRRRKVARISRARLLEMVNRRVTQLGLADAVPVTA